MIIIEFRNDIGNYLKKEFNKLDEFLIWYFNDDNSTWFINEIIEGHSIITGEIKQKGINNN